MDEDVRRSVIDMRKNHSSVDVSSVDGYGYPITRAMFVLEHEQIRTQYFATHLLSGKVEDYLNDCRASVYYSEEKYVIGVLFVGKMEVCSDHVIKEKMWRKSFVKDFPLGVSDPNYCVLKFSAEKGRFYNERHCEEFDINEFVSEDEAWDDKE